MSEPPFGPEFAQAVAEVISGTMQIMTEAGWIPVDPERPFELWGHPGADETHALPDALRIVLQGQAVKREKRR